jgi:hypothetical protein
MVCAPSNRFLFFDRSGADDDLHVYLYCGQIDVGGNALRNQ